MPRKQSRSAATLNELDALSLDDLDRVVGGGGGTTTQNSEQPPHEGGYTPPPPPVVHAPADLPTPIQNIENQVTNHTLTGDQAVTAIAGIIGSAPDHSMQSMAGAEIASLIGRGDVTATGAIADLHSAVTQNHSLTGDQAAGVLAGMVLAQYTTPGESSYGIGTAATGEINALISAGSLTADHAMSAFAAAAGTAGYSAMPLLNEMTSLAQQNNMSPAEVAQNIGATVDSHDLTGTQAVSVLAAMATDLNSSTFPMIQAAGAEIADLVANHGVAAADAMAGISSANSQGNFYEGEMPALLLATVNANPTLADAAGAELATQLGYDSYWASASGTSGAHYQFEQAVSSFGVSTDHMTDLLVSVASHGQAGWAAQTLVDMVEATGSSLSVAAVMTAIENNTTTANADGAVHLLLGLATNGGYGATFAPSAETALTAMVQSGQIDATLAANDIAANLTGQVYSYSSGGMVQAIDDPFYGPLTLKMLMSVAAAGTDAASAVTTVLDGLIAAHTAGTGGCAPLDLVTALANSVGSYSTATANPVLDAAITHQLSGLVSTGAVSADAAIEAISNAVVLSSPYTGKGALCDEIVSIATAAGLSPAQVVADVMANPPQNTTAMPDIVLLHLATHGAAWQAAAVTGLLGMISPTSWAYPNGDVMAANLPAYMLNIGMTVDNAVNLLTALVGDGTTAVHANAAGAEIANLINTNKISTTQAIGDLHAAVAGGQLGGHAALALLANVASNASSAQVVVNTELVALISGASPLIPRTDAISVLTTMQSDPNNAGNAALLAVLASEITVLQSSDPTTAVFQGINATTNATDMESAAAQLAAMIANGGASVDAVMNHVDQAFSSGALGAPQAAELLVDIAAHGNLAAQSAAGKEFGKIADTAGASIFTPSGTITVTQFGAINSCLAIGLGGSVDSTMQHVSTAMSPQAALAFVLGALGSNSISEPTRTNFEAAMSTLLGGDWYGVPVLFPGVSYPPAMVGSLASTINQIATNHDMPGPELIRAVFVLGDGQYFSASQELQTLITSQSVSMTDVNTAITSGWWQPDNAVQVLASMSSSPAALTEINSLLGSTLSVARLISDLHDGLTGGNMHGHAVAAGNVADVLGMLATSSDSNTLTLISNELASDLIHGQLSAANAAAVLTAAGANHSVIVDQMLSELGTLASQDAGTLLGVMLANNLTTFDHVFSLTGGASPTLSPDTLATVLRSCVTFNQNLTADQVSSALAAGVTDGALAPGQAMRMVTDWADNNATASLGGQVFAALVATGQVDAGSALNGLTQATTNTQLSLSAMPVFLESFVAHTTSANIGAACQGAMNLLGMGLPADNVMGLLIQFAGSANTSALTQIGEEFSYLVTSGRENLALIEIELGQSITAGSLTSGHAMTIYAGIAEGASMNGDATTATAALGQITALMQPPVNGSAQDAFTAFCSVAGSLAATQSSSLMQAVGAQMYALVAADPSALSGMGAAISGGTLTSAQAAGLLLGMLHNTDVVDQLVMPQSVPSAIVGEIDTLVSGNLMAPTDFLQALSNSVGTNAVTADAAVSILANCWPSAGASFANQIAGTLITMIQGGLSATQVLYDINGTINHPLTVDQAVGLMTALSSPNTQMGSTISAAVATDLINILSQGGAVMTIDQVISGIDHAVTNTTHPVDAGSAVALLAQLGNYAVQNPTAYISFDMGRLVVQEIVSLIASNPAGAALLYTVAPALANTPDHGVGFMMDIAAHSTQACQIAFGSIVANLVGNQTMTAADIVAEIRTAYATGLTQGTFTPFALGVVTASQELGLLAGVLAGVASPGHLDASTLNTAVHAELLAAIQTPPLRATDVQVAAALEAVGVNSGQILAAVNTEIAKLEDDVGPKMLIDVAATTHADMGAVGTQLTQLIQNGKITVGEAMNDIVAANANGYLTGSQALAMVTSALASTTSVGIYLSPTATGNNNWFVSTAGAFEALVQRAANNISAESIGAAIESMSGIGPTLLYPSSAVSMLASIAAYPDLQATAATHIGNLIAGNTGPNADSNLAPNNVAMSVAACVSSVAAPGHLTAAEAVQLLATVAAHGGAASTYGGIAQGLGDPSVVTVISPDIVATTIEGMLNSTPPTLTAQQALHFLAPYGAAGPEAVGHAIGDLITAGQVSMADFTALIYGGAQQTEQQIQSLRWGQAFGSGQIDFSDAVLVLTAMTSRTPAAVAELATIMSSDTDYVGTLVEQRLVNAGQHPTTSGPTPLEVVRALVTLMVDPRMTQVYGASTANHILDDMFSFVNISPSIPAPTLPTQYWLSSSDILSAIIPLAVDSTPAVEQGATTLVNLIIGAAPNGLTDPIMGAVGHGITADQAVTLLTQSAGSVPQITDFTPASTIQQVTNTLSHARADIASLIASGQLTGAQALGDMHAACVANNIGAGQELALLSGIFEDSGGNANVQKAVAQEIDTLIGSGRFNLQQAIDAIAAGTYLPNSNFPTQAQTTASFVAGGLESSAAAALMAMVAANSNNPAAPGVVAGEIASLIAGNRLDPAQAMSGIDAAVASGALDAGKAVMVLASTPLSASDSVHAAIGAELASLITGSASNRISLDNAVGALVSMAQQGQMTMSLEAGAALGELVAHGALNAGTAVADIQAATTLTPDQAVAMLAGMTIDATPAVTGAVAQAIAQQIQQHGEPVGAALTTLLTAAELGSPTLQAGVGATLGTLVSTNTIPASQAMQAIDVAVSGNSNTHLSTAAATNLLMNIAGAATGATAAATEIAVGAELGHVIQLANSTGGLAAQLAASNLTQDQAAVLLAAAIANTSASMGTPVAALIQNMVDSGPITIGQVLSDIDAALVSQTLTGAQALTALAHLEEAAPGTERMTIVNEVVALVSNGHVAPTAAAADLLAAAHGGSTALQSLVGGMLASLASSGHLTNQQVVDAINGATTLSSGEALGVLIGMSVNGNAAAQSAAGFGILSLVDSGRVDASSVISVIDNDARAVPAMITMIHAIDTLVAIMGATITNSDVRGATFFQQIPGEIASLTTSTTWAQWNSQSSLVEVLVQCAAGSMGMAQAVGQVFSALSLYNQTTPNALLNGPGPTLSAALAAAVNAHTISADQAVMVTVAASMDGQSQWPLSQLIQSGAVSADQAIRSLADLAVSIGDSAGTDMMVAFGPSAGTWTQRALLTPALEAIHFLIEGSAQISAQAAVTDILAAATQTHDFSPTQCASLLAALGGRLGEADALTMAGGIATMVAQGQLDTQTADHAIFWAISAGLDTNRAYQMFASMMLNPNSAVEQIALVAFDIPDATLCAQHVHMITTSTVFTHDQMLSIMAGLAHGLAAAGSPGASAMSQALVTEVTAMVVSGQITADHAVTTLAGIAATGGLSLATLSTEIDALIAANKISFGQVVTDLTSSGFNADQVVNVLVGMSAGNNALDPQVLGQITAMVNSGALSPAQAMTDIGHAPPDVGLRLLTTFAGAAPALEDAAAAELASLWEQGAGGASFYNSFYSYSRAHLGDVLAFGWIFSVAAHGNDALKANVEQQIHWDMSISLNSIATCLTTFAATYTPSPLVQYYIGVELGRLIDTPPAVTQGPPAPAVTNAIDGAITGTATNTYLATVPGATAATMPKALPPDTAAMIMLGLSSSTHNSDAQATASHDLKQLSTQIDTQFVVNIAQALPPQQALAQFVNMLANNWAPTALVAKQISDMVANGSLTAAQVLTAMAPLTTSHQLALVTDILGNHEAGSSAFNSQFATLTLLSWGVAPASAVYTQLHDALVAVIPDFVGLARGTTTATQAMNDIRSLASAHNVSVDLLLMAAYQSAAQDADNLGAAGAAATALTTIGQELYNHLTDGSAAQAIAGMVVGGSMTEAQAATLMRDLVSTATVPPSDIMQQVASGNMSAWYAELHHPNWNLHTEQMQEFATTQAVSMMHVDVHVAQDSAAVLAGTMTAQAAVDDVLAAGGTSHYAQDLGLLALAHDFATANASQTVQETVGLAMTVHLASGESQLAVVNMAAHGWLSPQNAIDMVIKETTVAIAGVDPNAGAAFSAMALAKLDLVASGQVDPNATVAAQEAHAHVTSGAIQNLLETQQASRILFGLGTLQTFGNDTYQNGAALALSQHMMGVVISQLQAQDAQAAASGGPNIPWANGQLPDWMGSMPPAAQQTVHYADRAMQMFVLGVATGGVLDILAQHYSGVATVLNYASPGTQLIEHGPQLLQLAVEHYAPATDVYALTQNDKSVQNWVNLGVDCAVSGVPLAGQLGLPTPLGGIQSYVLNSALGEGAGGTFLAVNIGSHVALAVLEMGVVQDYFKSHPLIGALGETATAMLGVVAESCTMISSMISGACHVEANMIEAVGVDTVNTFKDIFTHQDAAADATQLGKAVFAVFTMGGNFDDYEKVGDDVGNAMVDIFSGHPQNLGSDIGAIGKDYLHLIADNQFLQMASNVAVTYLQKLDDYLGNPSQQYTSEGLKQFLGLPTNVSWDTMFSTTGQFIGDQIKGGFDTLGDDIKHIF